MMHSWSISCPSVERPNIFSCVRRPLCARPRTCCYAAAGERAWRHYRQRPRDDRRGRAVPRFRRVRHGRRPNPGTPGGSRLPRAAILPGGTSPRVVPVAAILRASSRRPQHLHRPSRWPHRPRFIAPLIVADHPYHAKWGACRSSRTRRRTDDGAVSILSRSAPRPTRLWPAERS